jgi:hypothetical protein
MRRGTEAITYNLIHVLHRLVKHPEIMNRILAGLNEPKAESIWKDPKGSRSPISGECKIRLYLTIF